MKRIKATWAASLMLAVFTAFPVFGSTVTVTNTLDSGPGSLRNAIASAASGDTINFSVAGTITLTAASGELLINENLTISGPGASSLAISGNNSSRVFEIGSGFTVTISGVTIQNGSAGAGGGILNSGTLMLSNSTLSGNSTNGDNGGGIYNHGGTLTVTNSTISGNSANGGGSGGGIFNYLGTLTVTSSTLSGNSVVGSGFIVGGGIYIYAGTVTVTNTTLSCNSAYAGGGIYTYGATPTLTNSTLSGNSAPYGGGGIFVYNNRLIAKNTILANNSIGGNCYNFLTSQGYNLSDDTSCTTSFNQTGDLNNTPAGLDPGGLKSNGGPTQTIALTATSPAVDAIPTSPTNYCTDVNGAPVTTDQRGITRPQGPACDIGAFELVTDDDSGLAQLNGSNAFTGNQTVNGNLSATNFTGDGAGLTQVAAVTANTANLATDAGSLHGVAASNYARLDVGNNFRGDQNVSGNMTLNGNQAVVGSVGVNVAPNAGAGIQTLGSQYGVYGTSGGIAGVTGTGPFGVQGIGSIFGVVATGLNGALWAQTNGSTSTAVLAVSQSAPGVNTAASGVFNNFGGGNILIGQNRGMNKIIVDGNGSLATQGSVAIGGGTAIVEHLSVTFNPSFPALKPSTCATANFTLNGASDGDTLALGVPNARTTGGGTITYFAWVSAANTITVQACNISASPQKTAGLGAIRVDLWKH